MYIYRIYVDERWSRDSYNRFIGLGLGLGLGYKYTDRKKKEKAKEISTK